MDFSVTAKSAMCHPALLLTLSFVSVIIRYDAENVYISL